MALPITYKDINKNKQPQQGQTQQQGQPQPQQPGVAQYQPKQKGSGFTNLQRVVGASQGNRLGQSVGQGLQNVAGGTQQQLQQGQQQFQQQSEAQRLDTAANRQLQQNVLQRYAAGQQTPNLQDPTQQEIEQFRTFRSGQYSGPTQLQNQQSVMARGQELGDLTGAMRGGDTSAALQRFVGGRGRYAPGQLTLDKFLLGSQPNTDVREGVKQGAQASQAVQQGLRNVDLRTKDLQQRAKGFGEETTTGLKSSREEIGKEIEKKIPEAEKMRKEKIEALKKKFADIDSGDVELTEAELEDLGLKEKGKDFQNMSLFSNYADAIREGATGIGAETVADENQYVRAQALGKLLDNPESILTDRSKAGSFYKDIYDVDKEKLKGLREKSIQDAINYASGALRGVADARRQSMETGIDGQIMDPAQRHLRNLVGPNTHQKRGIERAQREAETARQQLRQFGINASTQDILNLYNPEQMANTDEWYRRTYGSPNPDANYGVTQDDAIKQFVDRFARKIKVKKEDGK